MDQRTEQILLTLARQYAAPLLQTWERGGDYTERLPRLARGLANYGILVIMGDQSYSLRGLGEDVRTQMQEWVNGYGQFYNVVAQTLFPSLNQVSAHYTDDKWPVLIYMKGNAIPVIQRMAGYIAPFIYYRQMDSRVSEAELLGLMDLILEELEANTLALDSYRRLRADGITVLKRMLEAQIRQLVLTEFDQPLFTDSRRFIPIVNAPQSLPEEHGQVPPAQRPMYTHPDTASLPGTETIQTINLPTPPPKTETSSNPTVLPEEKRFGSSIPIFFNRKDNSKKIRRPPIPPLPGDKDS